MFDITYSTLTESIRLIESENENKVIKCESTNNRSVVLTNKGHLYSWNHNHDSTLASLGERPEMATFCSLVSKSLYKPVLLEFSVNNYIIDVCCGYLYTLLLTKFGKVYGFGRDMDGSLGCGTCNEFYAQPVKVLFPDEMRIISISSGNSHALALSQSGYAYSWGCNKNGQLGINSTIDQYKPVLIEVRENNSILSIRKIACGTNHSLLLSDDGDVYSFGNSSYLCELNKQGFPLKVNSKLKFVDMSAHFNKSIALSETGKFYIWGECGQSYYQSPTEIEAKSFGDIYEKFSSKEETIDIFMIENENTKKIEAKLNVKVIKCLCTTGTYTVLTNNGKVFTWEEDMPGKIEMLENIFSQPIIDICCGNSHVLYLTSEGSVFAFGANSGGQCGCVLFSPEDKVMQRVSHLRVTYPAKVIGLESNKIVAIACGENHSLLLTSNGEVYGSGWNLYGQLGFKCNTKNSIQHDFIMSLSMNCIKIVCGTHHSLILCADGCVYGFGFNENGQCGSGLQFYHNEPLTYKDNPKFVDILAYKNFSLALSESGYCYVWGNCFQVNIIKPTQTPFRSMQEGINYYVQNKGKNLNDKIKSTAQYQWYQSWNMLGEGNFSKVVKSNNLLDQKDYAIRVRAINYDKISEIWKELNIWRKLKCDFVTPVLDFWFDENTDKSSQNLVKYDMECQKQSLLLSIKTEVCDTTLTDLMNIINEEFNLKELERHNTISYFISSQIFIQILEGVNYLHSQTPPVIHRDLKPDNILITLNSNRNTIVRINDFGLSEDFLSEGQPQALYAGTPKYKAPEKIVTTKSDLYSLGIIMSDLMHINMNSFEDYETESDDLINRKYIESANVCEQLIKQKLSLRPDCTDLLNNKNLWSILSDEYCVENVEMKNPLLKEILKVLSYDIEVNLIKELQNSNNENVK